MSGSTRFVMKRLPARSGDPLAPNSKTVVRTEGGGAPPLQNRGDGR